MSQEADLSTTVFHDPAWIATFGAFLHANNVLFYFRQSPFYDRLSSNEVVFAQSTGNPEREQRYLSTRRNFENELQNHVGTQYTVVYDPVETRTLIKNPNGVQEQSDVWVIKKARRENLQQARNDLEVLDYYYIVNSIIFQAPRLDAMVNYHMTNVNMSLDKMIKAVTALPKFSPSMGYQFLKDSQKSAVRPNTAGQHSKVGTPIPDAGISSQDTVSAQDEKVVSDRTLREALSLTMNFGEQFYDDAPLSGEPGSFRYAKTKDPVASLRATETAIKSQPVSKAGTPVPSQPASQATKATASASSTQDSKLIVPAAEQPKPKPKRKKSVMVNGTS